MNTGMKLLKLENKSIINVKVVKQVNGGVIAAYKKYPGFIPLSQLSDKLLKTRKSLSDKIFR